MKKKILFFIHDLSYGGAEKVLVNLVNNMDLNKFDITVQTIFDIGINKEKLNKNIRYIGGFKHIFRGNSYLFKLFSPNVLYRFFIKEDYDVVVSYLEGPTARIISGCQKENIKKICWIHTQMDNEYIYKRGFRNLKEANRCYKVFDMIICVSKMVKECFLKIADCELSNIDVKYNTNDTNFILTKSKEEIDDIKFDRSIVNICSVGKIVEVKGFFRLSNVHKRLLDENLKHHIYILGVGNQKKEIENYIRKYNLENTFTFLGFKKNPYKYVKECDLYICSSYREGFSTAVTESLIVGTPVVSTLCSGAQELLGYNNEYGLVVENSEQGIYDGLKYMIANKDELLRYKELAKIRGSFFSTENTVKAVEDMLINIKEGNC